MGNTGPQSRVPRAESGSGGAGGASSLGPAGAGAGQGRAGRLHPLAIAVFARRMVSASLLPILVVVVAWRPTFVVPGLLALAALGVVVVVLEWRRFTYRIEGGRLVIERGVVHHTTRVVPLDRIRGCS